MSDEITEQHIHKIREIGLKHAKASKDRTYLEHSRHILLAKLMKEHMVSSNTGKLDSVSSQNREARADPRYETHIKGLAEAVEEELKWEWEKFIVRTNFEMWKTKMINQFKEAKDYGVKK